MKKAILLLIMAFAFINTISAQVYTCPEIKEAIAKWNSLTNKKNNVKWAESIRDNKLYQQNADGSFEYVYILRCNDSINVTTLRKIGFDFINYYFPNLGNDDRADMETNSPKDGVIFKGIFSNVGSFDAFFNVNRISANVVYDIRFKPNRIRFSIKVQNYQVKQYNSDGYLTQNYTSYVNNCFPLNPGSDHKKSYAMAFINVNAKCLDYVNYFMTYVNKHIVENQPTEVGDW